MQNRIESEKRFNSNRHKRVLPSKRSPRARRPVLSPTQQLGSRPERQPAMGTARWAKGAGFREPGNRPLPREYVLSHRVTGKVALSQTLERGPLHADPTNDPNARKGAISRGRPDPTRTDPVSRAT